MDAQLERKLFKKYPKLYCQRFLPMIQTCMCWGIDCNNGWYKLIDELSAAITEVSPKTEATQVKEKYGGLRFYVSFENKAARKLIDEAEIESYKICETCGSRRGVKQTKGWITTLCETCMKHRCVH